MAAATKAPFICIVQNNPGALGTQVDVHSQGSFAAYGDAYGFKTLTMDGNNVWTAMRLPYCNRGVSSRRRPHIYTETFEWAGATTMNERLGNYSTTRPTRTGANGIPSGCTKVAQICEGRSRYPGEDWKR